MGLWVETLSLPIFFSFVVQETFDAGLQAFEKEGIQTITALKDQLVAANHAQTPAIEKRYNDVMDRYDKVILWQFFQILNWRTIEMFEKMI